MSFKNILFLFLIVSSLYSYKEVEQPVLFPQFLNCLEYTQKEVCFCCQEFFGTCQSNNVHKFDCLCDELEVPINERRNYTLGEKDEY